MITEIFWGVEYECGVEIKKLKMADPIWLTKIKFFLYIGRFQKNLIPDNFLGRRIRKWGQNSKIKNGGLKMAIQNFEKSNKSADVNKI